MNILEVQNLCKTYGSGEAEVNALNQVSFSVRKGEFIAIIGESGSGKSTLLNIVGGLDNPTSGKVWIDGKDVFSMSEKKLTIFRRQHIGFIFQSYNLLPTLSAVENVALPLTFQGVNRKMRTKRANELLNLVGLATHKKHKPTQMSGGQQQRVGMARALVVEPEIIFADEPTGNLDSVTSEEMMQLMRKVVYQRHQTLVMVTHDDHLASYADRIIRIRDGKVISITEKTEEERREMIEELKRTEQEKKEKERGMRK